MTNRAVRQIGHATLERGYCPGALALVAVAAADADCLGSDDGPHADRGLADDLYQPVGYNWDSPGLEGGNQVGVPGEIVVAFSISPHTEWSYGKSARSADVHALR